MYRYGWRQVAGISALSFLLGLALFGLAWLLEGPAELEVLGLVAAVGAFAMLLGTLTARLRS